MKSSFYTQNYLYFLIVFSLLSFFTIISTAQANSKKDKCEELKTAVFMAARTGDLREIRDYKRLSCNLKITDRRGFNLFDLATLHGNEQFCNWLISENIAHQGQYSRSLLKLVQTGLRFLNFDAGVIDGKYNNATTQAIKAFQKSHSLAQTGKITPQWMALFHRDLIQKMQIKLSEIGFSAGSADGAIGANTRSAMQAFRQERNMPATDYGFVDDQLIYQLMMAESEAMKKAIARRDAERLARQATQQAAQKEEIARNKAAKQKRAAEKRRRAEAAAEKKRREKLEEQQNNIEIAAPKPTIRIISNPQEIQKQPLLPNQPEQVRLHNAQQIALQEAQVQVDRSAEIARLEEQRAKEQAIAAQQAAQQARDRAANARKAAKLAAKQPNNVANPVKKVGKFNEISGKLKFVTKNGKIEHCTIAGHTVGISWCEIYYPPKNNKDCDAIISESGVTVSLLCK